MSAASSHYLTAVMILFLIAVFLFGYYFEVVFLKRKDLACLTWFWGLMVLAIWIVYPLTLIRVCVGTIVSAVGLFFLYRYYIRSKKESNQHLNKS